MKSFRIRDTDIGTPLMYTPEQVADLLNVGRTTVYELLKTGELKSVKINRSRRILPEQLEEFVQGLRVESSETSESDDGSMGDLPVATTTIAGARTKKATTGRSRASP
jgi:excisionase family DNA binding protein